MGRHGSFWVEVGTDSEAIKGGGAPRNNGRECQLAKLPMSGAPLCAFVEAAER